MANAALAGMGVLVTRPRQQADELVHAIEQQGGTAFRLATIEIEPRAPADIASDLSALGEADIAIFASPNAVQYGLAHTSAAAIAAIGPATAAAIESAGRRVDIVPASGYNSEHLLAEADLADPAGKTIRIIRGQSGRELLGDTLRDRGATVEYLSVYSRSVPEYAADELIELQSQWLTGHINAVTIMSVEALLNLVHLLPSECRKQLANTPLVTPAARVIKEALDQFPDIPATLARGPQADDMVDAIIALGQETTGHPR